MTERMHPFHKKTTGIAMAVVLLFSFIPFGAAFYVSNTSEHLTNLFCALFMLLFTAVKSYFCWKSGGGKRVLGWLRFAWQNQPLVEDGVLRAA